MMPEVQGWRRRSGWRRMGPGRSGRAYSRVCGAATAKGSEHARVMRRQDPQPELLRGLGAAEADEGVTGLGRDLGGAAA